jgi:hypothetical protein
VYARNFWYQRSRNFWDQSEQVDLAPVGWAGIEQCGPVYADLFGVPRSTVYGHLDREKIVLRQPKGTAPAKL